MRETMVALLMLGTVAAVSSVSQQRSCVAPLPSTEVEEDEGKPASFHKVKWTLQR